MKRKHVLDQSQAPIYQALQTFRQMRVVPFDVPGHKRGRGNPELTEFLGQQCVSIDVNSMKPLDNLCHPISVIRQAEELAAQADVITPNLTEASLLLGEDYASCPGDEAGLRAWLERLSLDGQRSVVLTGVGLHPGVTGAACFDRETGRISFAMARQEPTRFSGTGDLFASVLLGSLLRGEGLAGASQRAADFVQHCVAYTLAVGTPLPEGVQFEPLLGELMGPAPSRTDVR